MKSAPAAKACFILGVIALLAASQSCSMLNGSEGPAATLAALKAAVIQTETAAVQQSPKENKLETVYVEATATGQAIHNTQTAQPVPSEDKKEEATIVAPILAELPQYGLEKIPGRTGWVHDPLTLDITGYQEFTYGNDHMEVTAADFAMAADITWDTRYGSSGCGFMFRSDGNKNKPNQYMLIATRFGNGHVIFTALAEGEIANIHDFYPKTEDRSFQWENGTTNRLAVVARGTLIEIYTNGVKIGEVDTNKPPARLPEPPKPLKPVDLTDIPALDAYKTQIEEYEAIIKKSESSYQIAMNNYMNRKAVFDDGFLGMIAATESGRTVCTFEDAWLWLIEP